LHALCAALSVVGALTPSRAAEGAARGRQSRSEKKSRKAMQKLGMKPVPSVVKVTIKKSKNVRQGVGVGGLGAEG